MQRYIVKDLASWHEVNPQDAIRFPKGQSGRTVKFTVNASRDVEIWAAENSDMAGEKLIATDCGLFEVEVSTRGDLFVMVRLTDVSDPARVFIRTRDADHRVAPVSDVKFTQLEQRRTMSPELEQVMRLVRHNEAMREAQLRASLEQMNRQISEMKANVSHKADDAPEVGSASVDQEESQDAGERVAGNDPATVDPGSEAGTDESADDAEE